MNLFLPTLQTRNNSIKLAFSKIKKAIQRLGSDLLQTMQEGSDIQIQCSYRYCILCHTRGCL